MLDYYILIKKINGILLKYHKVKNSFVGIFLPPFFFFVFIPILTTLQQFFPIGSNNVLCVINSNFMIISRRLDLSFLDIYRYE